MNPTIKEFFDIETWTLTYVVYDKESKEGAIIDPVWNYNPNSSKLSSESVDLLLDYIAKNKIKINYILETHAHADHISSAQVLKEKLPNSKIGIGANITKVQSVFKNYFNLDENFKANGKQFDLLLTEENSIYIGSLEIKTLFTPGHTPACVCYLIGDCVFTGDLIFMPDYGTGRCDFPSGSAEDLYDSIQDKLFALPDHTKVYVGHDYLPNQRSLAFQSTILEEKMNNIQLKRDTKKEDFVLFRKNRDKNLSAPRLLFPSVQINIDAGKLPIAEENGSTYLKIPLTFK